MDNRHAPPPKLTPVKERTSSTEKRRRILIIGILLLFIVIAILWIWKQVQINNLRNASLKQYEQLEMEAERAVVNSHEQHLRLLAKPFAWAVRSEMMNNNISQLNQYTNELIKEKNIHSISIVNADGKIVTSTNKKWEGRFYFTIGEEAHLKSDSTVVRNVRDSILIMSSPIMNLNSRLGTLIVTYSLKSPVFIAANTRLALSRFIFLVYSGQFHFLVG